MMLESKIPGKAALNRVVVIKPVFQIFSVTRKILNAAGSQCQYDPINVKKLVEFVKGTDMDGSERDKRTCGATGDTLCDRISVDIRHDFPRSGTPIVHVTSRK